MPIGSSPACPPGRGSRRANRPRTPHSHVIRGVGSLAWKHQARIRFPAPVEVIAESLPPEAGLLRPDGEDSCVLETGSDSLRELIRYLTGLDTAFEVLDPPELRTLLRELADRYAAAAGDPSPAARD